METRHLFERLPEAIFKPLGSSLNRLYWRVLERLHIKLFEEDVDVSEYGHARQEVIRVIESVIESYPNLWLPDDEEASEPDTPINVRANQTYARLLSCGWLQEERRGYHTFVSMPHNVSQLMSSLLEIAEGRPLVMTGKLKSIRAAIQEVVSDPAAHADTLIELAKDATRFSRHLKGIRGSIKDLYDRIQGEIRAKEVIRTFFDDFLREIFIRDYATIKTSDNPLTLRDFLLEQVASGLRYNQENYRKLLAGYRNIYSESESELNLQRDLSRLESVFFNIEAQLDAIDSMKVRYEQRVDAVIDYARRSPRQTGRIIQQVITALATHADQKNIVDVPIPWITGESHYEIRLFKPKRPRKPPEPRTIRFKHVDPEMVERIRQERMARQAAQVTEKGLVELLQQQLGRNVIGELTRFQINTIRDYFHILALHRLAKLETVKQGATEEHYPLIGRNYRLSATSEMVDTEYLEMTKVIIQRTGRIQ